MHIIWTGVQIGGCVLMVRFAVRGVLADMYDFTSWILRRNGIKPEEIRPGDSRGSRDFWFQAGLFTTTDVPGT